MAVNLDKERKQEEVFFSPRNIKPMLWWLFMCKTIDYHFKYVNWATYCRSYQEELHQNGF